MCVLRGRGRRFRPKELIFGLSLSLSRSLAISLLLFPRPLARSPARLLFLSRFPPIVLAAHSLHLPPPQSIVFRGATSRRYTRQSGHWSFARMRSVDSSPLQKVSLLLRGCHLFASIPQKSGVHCKCNRAVPSESTSRVIAKRLPNFH